MGVEDRPSMSVLMMTSLPVHLSLFFTTTITIHYCAAQGLGLILDSILSSIKMTSIGEETTETMMNPVDTQYQSEFSERHGYHSQYRYHNIQEVLASSRQDSSELATFIVPIGPIKFLFQNTGGIILWLSILLMNLNLTYQIQNLTSELEETKSSLLSKLENNDGLIEELSNNISSVCENDNGILETEVDSDRHEDYDHDIDQTTSIVESGASSFTNDVLETYVDDLEDNSVSDDIINTQSQLEDEASFLESILDELVKIRSEN